MTARYQRILGVPKVPHEDLSFPCEQVHLIINMQSEEFKVNPVLHPCEIALQLDGDSQGPTHLHEVLRGTQDSGTQAFLRSIARTPESTWSSFILDSAMSRIFIGFASFTSNLWYSMKSYSGS